MIRCDPREEHDLAERDRPGLGLAERGLPAVDGVGRGRVEGVVDRDLMARVEAERDQVLLELLDVGAVADPLGQRPVGGDRPVHQHHGRPVDLVQRLPRLDHVTDLRQPGDRAADPVEDALRVGVAERAGLGVGGDEVTTLDGRRAGALRGRPGGAGIRARPGGADDEHCRHRGEQDRGGGDDYAPLRHQGSRRARRRHLGRSWAAGWRRPSRRTGRRGCCGRPSGTGARTRSRRRWWCSGQAC